MKLRARMQCIALAEQEFGAQHIFYYWIRALQTRPPSSQCAFDTSFTLLVGVASSF